MSGRVTWRGVVLDARTAHMMDEVARITGSVYVEPTQGSYSTAVGASAGTHAGGGAIDIRAAHLRPADRDMIVTQMRRVGFAAWLRTPQQSTWPYHIHGIAVGCPDLSRAAAAQVDDYRAGRNGLAGRAPDDGTRAYTTATWERYERTTTVGDVVDEVNLDYEKIGKDRLIPRGQEVVLAVLDTRKAKNLTVEHQFQALFQWGAEGPRPNALRIRFMRQPSKDGTGDQDYCLPDLPGFKFSHQHQFKGGHRVELRAKVIGGGPDVWVRYVIGKAWVT